MNPLSESTKFVASNLPGEIRMLDVLRAKLGDSTDVAISVSFLRYSGLALIIEDLKRFIERGGRVRIITSTYMGITQPEALKQLIQIKGLECRLHVTGASSPLDSKSYTGFHTKLFIFKNGHKECWVGSSNLTKGGLASNIEANLCQVDTDAIKAVERVFDVLWSRHDVIPLSIKLADDYAETLLQFHWPPCITPVFATPEYQKATNDLDEVPPEVVVSKIFDYPVSLETAGFQTENTLNEPSGQYEKSALPMPNDAQKEALIKLRELRDIGEKKAAVIAAPGVGKTFLAAFDAQQCGAKSMLFLSNRLEHISQARRTFAKVFNDSVSYGSLYGNIDQSTEDFVFSTIQSAAHNTLLLSRRFDYAVVDEFHHSEATSYQRILEKISACFLLGLTATPERQDGHDVLRLCDYNVAYEVRLVQAINRGWLIPFHYFGVKDDIVDYSSIPWRSSGFEIEALENALMLETRVDEIIKHALEKGFDGVRRATVGFCAGIRHAKFMAAALCRRGLNAVSITGEQSLEFREQVYQRFANTKDPLEWIFVADVLNEGVDIPAINSILFLRPTQSATVFIQQLGRGLRKSEDCEVLTIIDFVGHHRSAWLAIEALHDRDAGCGSSSISALSFTPPANCEVILDQKTLEILTKVRQHTESKKDQCLNAYSALKSESRRPYPLDLWGREDCPDIGTFRASFKSWIGLRIAANDGDAWEASLGENEPAYKFLAALERDWQQGRVYSYALVWGLAMYPEMEASKSYDLFFERFPRWQLEYKSLHLTKAWQTLEKKISEFLDIRQLNKKILTQIPSEQIQMEIEGRLRLTLEKDYKLRHGGILRAPEELILHRRYDRAEIINHFREQYDPSRHNFGVINFKKNVVIIAKIDTSSAIQNFQYSNNFLDERTFSWQSQNQQRQDNASGKSILDHRTNGNILHLFVQARSHEKAYYCGVVSVTEVTGDAPMNVTLQLEHTLPESIYRDLKKQ